MYEDRLRQTAEYAEAIAAGASDSDALDAAECAQPVRTIQRGRKRESAVITQARIDAKRAAR